MLGKVQLGTFELGTAPSGSSSGSFVYGQANADIKATSNKFAQSQADILHTYQGYAQCQADIKQTYQAYGQCQTTVIKAYQGYGQGQAQIIAFGVNRFAQAQADVKQTYQSYAQAQSDIKQTYLVFAQSQAAIINTYKVYGQAQSDILATTKIYGQAQAKINAFGVNRFAQAQATLPSLYETTVRADTPYGWWRLNDASGTTAIAAVGPNGTYKSSGITYQTYVPMPTDNINQAVSVSGAAYMNSNAADDTNNFSMEVWTTPTISIQLPSESTSGITGGGTAGANSGGQNYVWFPNNKDSDRGLGVSVGTNGINVYAHGSGNIYALASYSGTLSGAMHHVVVTVSSKVPRIYLDGVLVRTGLTETATNAYRPTYLLGQDSYGAYLGKANNAALYDGVLSATQILNHYQAGVPRAYGQAQAVIFSSPTKSGQAQADIKHTYNAFAQANADIKQTYQVFAQAQAHIVLTYQVFAQAQAQIRGTYNVFAQANADILTTYQVYGQAQGTLAIRRFVFAQAQATIRANVFGQSQATIVINTSQFAQAKGLIYRTEQKYAQTQALLLAAPHFYGHAQATADIFAITAHPAQVTALINSPIKIQSATAQGYIVKPAGYGQALALIVVLKGWAQSQAQIKRFAKRQHAQAGALIVNKKKQGQAQADIKKATRAHAQASVFINRSIKFAQARAFINKSRAQAQAQARIISFKTLANAQTQAKLNSQPFNFGQAQTYILIVGFALGQAQATIRGNSFGQTQADILAKSNKYGQAMAHILGNTGYGQANARIDGPLLFIIEDLLGDAHTYSFNKEDIWGASQDMLLYGNDIAVDPDPYPPSADGSWANFYDRVVDDNTTVPAPNGWFYFTLNSIAEVHLDTFKFGGFQHDSLIGIFTGDSSAGNWTPLAQNDDYRPYGVTQTYESYLSTVLGPGTYLVIVGLYGLTIAGITEYLDTPPEYSVVDMHVTITSPNALARAAAIIYQPSPRQYGQAQAYIGYPAYGQAQAKINAFAVKAHGQAQAHIRITQGFGQAQAKLNSFGYVRTGQAQARIRFTYAFGYINGMYTYGCTNASNPYQQMVLDQGPVAYYPLNEPLPFSNNYDESLSAYKDIVWDNLGLYDMNRPYGNQNRGPYGGPLVNSFAQLDGEDFTPLLLPTLSAYGNDPTGIPGTNGDNGILSAYEVDNGFNYIYRYQQSSPILGHNYWAIEFWYRPLETPDGIFGDFPILRVGAPDSPNDAGAIEITYHDNKIQTYFGLGTGANSGPEYDGIVAGTQYHVVLASDFSNPTTTTLYINGHPVDSTTQYLTNINNTVFIQPNSVTNQVFLMDELALYNYDFPASSINPVMTHYLTGMGYTAGFGLAMAFIRPIVGEGQAQATIFNPWAKGQARAVIVTIPHRVAQAQALIKGYNTGQAQAYILTGTRGFGLANANISSALKKHGQAQAKITNKYPTGMAQAVIKTASYFVSFNGYQLPGYAQEESIMSEAEIHPFGAPFRDISFTEYMGLTNKHLSLRILVRGENYQDCKNQIELAGTLVRTKKHGFAPLYIQYYDRHFEALTTKIEAAGTTSNIKTAEYNLEFECKPWLVADQEKTLTGTTLVTTTGRDLDNGGWTPATLSITGTNVTVSGYTSTGEFTGFISVSGTVTNMQVNTEDYTATINGQNANAYMNNIDYQVYVGPGVTNFAITGATACTIKYRDRWYL